MKSKSLQSRIGKYKTPLMVLLLVLLSIVLTSIAYATPYNQTFNITSPSYYLEDGVPYSDSDSSFTTNTSIGSQLSDNSPSTYFTVMNSTQSADNVVLYTNHDGLDNSNTADINNNNEGIFTNLTISVFDTIKEIEFCMLQNTVSGLPEINISIAYNTTDSPIILNSFNYTISPDTWNCQKVSPVHFDLFTSDVKHIGVVCPNCNGGDKFKIRRDDDGSQIDFWTGAVWNSPDLGRSLMFNTTIRYEGGMSTDGDTLSLFFDHNFNNTQSHWLEVEKDDILTNELLIYAYQDNDNINTSNLVTHSFISGINIIDVSSLFSEFTDTRLRLFTNTPTNITEVRLIEEQIDLINPVIEIAINPTVDKILNNLTTQANCTDNRNLSFFRMHVYNSTTTIFDSTNTSTSTDTRLQIHELVDLTSIGIGDYTRNTTCVDENNNVENIIDIVTVVDSSPPIITLISPEDGQTIEIIDYPSQTDEVLFNWETNQDSDCDLLIDGNITDTIINQQEFTGLAIFPTNTMVDWSVNCTTTGSNLFTLSESREVTILHVVDTSFFQRGVCPMSTTGGSIFFIFMIALAFFLFFISLVTEIGIMAMMASVMMIMAGTFLFACATIFGTIMILFGILFLGKAIFDF